MERVPQLLCLSVHRKKNPPPVSLSCLFSTYENWTGWILVKNGPVMLVAFIFCQTPWVQKHLMSATKYHQCLKSKRLLLHFPTTWFFVDNAVNILITIKPVDPVLPSKRKEGAAVVVALQLLPACLEAIRTREPTLMFEPKEGKEREERCRHLIYAPALLLHLLFYFETCRRKLLVP